MLKKIVLWMGEENRRQVADRLNGLGSERQPAEYDVEPVFQESVPVVCGEEFALPWGADGAESLILTDSAEGYRAASAMGTACAFYCSRLEEDGKTPEADWVIEGTEGLDYEFLDRLYRRHHHIPWVIAVTKRCRIREMAVEDLDQLYALYGEPSIAEYVEPLFEDRSQEEAFTRAYIRNMYGFYGFGLWVVEDRESGRIIGRAGLSFREGYEELEIGYMISEKYRGRGYAAEACAAVMDYAAGELSCRALNAFVEEKNSASARLCRSLGFVRHSVVELKHKEAEREFVRYVWRRDG